MRLYSGKNGCIRARWFYFAESVVFGQTWFYSGKSGCVRAKVVVLGQSGCIRVVHLCGCNRANFDWLYSGKKVVFGQKVVVFGQKWLYSGKSCYIRAK